MLMRLECGQCVVRSWSHEDAERLRQLADNPLRAQWMSDVFPYPYTMDDARAFLNVALDANSEQGMFAIECREGLAGGIGFERFPHELRFTAEFGYWLGTEFWGRGIATAAARALCDWIFRETPIRRLQANVYAPNAASARVLEKSGFIHEATLRAHAFKHERFMDVLIFSRLAEVSS